MLYPCGISSLVHVNGGPRLRSVRVCSVRGCSGRIPGQVACGRHAPADRLKHRRHHARRDETCSRHHHHNPTIKLKRSAFWWLEFSRRVGSCKVTHPLWCSWLAFPPVTRTTRVQIPAGEIHFLSIVCVASDQSHGLVHCGITSRKNTSVVLGH